MHGFFEAIKIIQENNHRQEVKNNPTLSSDPEVNYS